MDGMTAAAEDERCRLRLRWCAPVRRRGSCRSLARGLPVSTVSTLRAMACGDRLARSAWPVRVVLRLRARGRRAEG